MLTAKGVMANSSANLVQTHTLHDASPTRCLFHKDQRGRPRYIFAVSGRASRIASTPFSSFPLCETTVHTPIHFRKGIRTIMRP